MGVLVSQVSMNTGYNHRVSPFRTEFCISGGFPYIKQCTKIEADVIEEAHAWLSDGVTGTERRWKLSPGFGTASALVSQSSETFVPLFQSPGQPPAGSLCGRRFMSMRPPAATAR